MSKSKRTRKDGVCVDTPWIPLSNRLISSRAMLQCSPHAAKLFLLLLSRLGANGHSNGR
jgi:hypothetical protein